MSASFQLHRSERAALQSRGDKRKRTIPTGGNKSDCPDVPHYSIITESCQAWKQRRDKTRLAQLLSDYNPSASSFSAIRTKSAREEAPIFRMTCPR